MRVLLVHNHYGSEAPSGENVVFEAERALLESRGHEVRTFVRHSDEIRGSVLGLARGALATPWNPWTAARMREVLEEFRPEVVHAHNTFPLLSPSVFHAVGTRAARVLTLHNYRLFCPAAVPLRDGRACTDCLDERSVLPSLRHGCYRASRLATLPLAFGSWLHRRIGTWTSQVDAFVALSGFQRDRMVAAGLPAPLVHVKPNFYPGRPVPLPWRERRDRVVFAGRLGPEKGVDTLIRAWSLWGPDAPELHLAGDGPERSALERLVETTRATRIRFLGRLSPEEAVREIASSRLVVLPSRGVEGFPLVIREAFAFGTPVAVSDVGPLPDLVGDGESGVVFAGGAPESLLGAVRRAWEDPPLLERLAAGARRAFERSYGEGAAHELLMAVYGRAMAVVQERRRACGR